MIYIIKPSGFMICFFLNNCLQQLVYVGICKSIATCCPNMSNVREPIETCHDAIEGPTML